MRRQNVLLISVLSTVGVAAVGIFFAVLRNLPSRADRTELWKEAGKASLQVLTVAVLGAVLKLAADHYREEQERLAQDARFRQDKYDRLVEATNTLRRVPILLDVDKSVEAFDEQLRQVMEAGLKLRMIKHQIWSSKDVRDPPFPDHRELTYLFESLYHYTDHVIRQFVETKQALPDAQERADAAELRSDERWRAADGIRLSVPVPNDVVAMREHHDSVARQSCRTQVELELEEGVPKNGKIAEPTGTFTWLRFEETEGLALERLTRATLDHRHRRPLRGRRFL